MTRDELVADLAQVIRDDTVGWNVADIADAVLARLEALGWVERGYCYCLCHAESPPLPAYVSDNVPCEKCGGDRLRPNFANNVHCHVGGPVMCGCGGEIETCTSCMTEDTCLDCHTCEPDPFDDDGWDDDDHV